jgi:hypothetical protein
MLQQKILNFKLMLHYNVTINLKNIFMNQTA